MAATLTPAQKATAALLKAQGETPERIAAYLGVKPPAKKAAEKPESTEPESDES